MRVRFVLPLLFVVSVVAIGLLSAMWQDKEPETPSMEQPNSSIPEDESSINQSELTPEPEPKQPDLRQKYCANSHQTACSGSWPSIDPSGKVYPDTTGEVRALRRLRNLIRENPSWTSEQIHEELARVIYTDSRRDRVQKGFRWVLNALQKLIQMQPDGLFSEPEKKAILGRLSLITLELPPPASVYQDAADLITKNTVYYERTPENVLRLRMGGAYLLNTTSWFNIVYTLSHELAHAIDPCELKLAGVLPRSYTKLVSCFVSAGWVSPQRSECGPHEQVSEVFADWIAAEITGQAIAEFGKGYSTDDLARAAINSTRDLCEQSLAVDSLNFNAHQQPTVRIGSIMGNNPAVRNVLDCKPAARIQYCRFEIPELTDEAM